MKIDISTTEKLAPLVRDRIIISESGISSLEDASRMITAGADAILVVHLSCREMFTKRLTN